MVSSLSTGVESCRVRNFPCRCILDSPRAMDTLHPLSRFVMGKLSGPFSAAISDTQMQSLCHRYGYVTPYVVRELECGTSYSRGEWSVGIH